MTEHAIFQLTVVASIAIETNRNIFPLISAAGGTTDISSLLLASPTVLGVLKMHWKMVLIEGYTVDPSSLFVMLSVQISHNCHKVWSHLMGQMPVM